jgi:hypothetical protein
MSYPNQGALAELPRSRQPVQQASWPVYDYPAYDYPEQSRGYGSGQPFPYPAAPNFGMPYYPQAYGIPAIGGYVARRRPGVVTAAAVLAFIVGGLGILVSGFLLLALAAGTASHTHASSTGSALVTIFFVAFLVVLAMSALWVWGGVSAVRGRGRKLLITLSSIQLACVLLSLAGNLAADSAGVGAALTRAVSGLVFALPILILILHRSSTEYFRNRGGMTNA